MRNPMPSHASEFLQLLDLRNADRQAIALAAYPPPRRTCAEPDVGPGGSVSGQLR